MTRRKFRRAAFKVNIEKETIMRTLSTTIGIVMLGCAALLTVLDSSTLQAQLHGTTPVSQVSMR